MVKILSRDAINRMVGRKSSVAGVGGGGGDVDLSGYATKIWTQETFVSIDFFRSLFRAYDSQNHEILPNDTTSTIDNIKAMFGFWTEQYISALGQNSGGGGGISLSEPLQSINNAGLGTPQTAGVGLVWNGTAWTYGNTGGGSGDVTWTALAAATNEQINASHLSTALSGYALTSQLSNYLPLSGGTMTGALKNNVEICCNEYRAKDRTYILGVDESHNVSLVSTATRGTLNINAATTYLYRSLVINDERTGSDAHPLLALTTGNNNWVGQFGYTSAAGVFMLRYLTNSTPAIFIHSSGNIGIGNFGSFTPSYKLHVEGVIGATGIMLKRSYDGDFYYYFGSKASSGVPGAATLEIYNTSGGTKAGLEFYNGTVTVNNNLYAVGAVTALSDARHKTIINPTDLQVEQIARMPAVVYRWNDGRDDNSLHVGSIAQDWQRILPEVVLKANDKEGTLSMQYGVAALVSSIITARKVVDHERRIAELERENKELKMKLNIA